MQQIVYHFSKNVCSQRLVDMLHKSALLGFGGMIAFIRVSASVYCW